MHMRSGYIQPSSDLTQIRFNHHYTSTSLPIPLSLALLASGWLEPLECQAAAVSRPPPNQPRAGARTGFSNHEAQAVPFFLFFLFTFLNV